MKPSLVSGILVLAFGGFLGYHVGYVRPRQAVAQIQLQLREAQQEQQLRTEVAHSFVTLERERQRFAPRPDPDWLLQEVSKRARDAGIEVTSLSPQPSQVGVEFTQLLVSLQLEATYHQLGQFLSHLESAEPIIRVDNLDVLPQRTAEGNAQVRMVLSTIYVPPIRSQSVTP